MRERGEDNEGGMLEISPASQRRICERGRARRGCPAGWQGVDGGLSSPPSSSEVLSSCFSTPP